MNPNPNKETPEQELEKALHHLAVVSRGQGFDEGVARERNLDPESTNVDHVIRGIMQLFATHYKAREAEIRQSVIKELYEGAEKRFLELLMHRGGVAFSEGIYDDTILFKVPRETLLKYYKDGELPSKESKS